MGYQTFTQLVIRVEPLSKNKIWQGKNLIKLTITPFNPKSKRIKPFIDENKHVYYFLKLSSNVLVLINITHQSL